MPIDFDDNAARQTFFKGLPKKYKDNTDFQCDDTVQIRKRLQRLREAIQTNVLEKLRNCRDSDAPLLLQWFRTCQYERKYEDADKYLAPKYADCCKTMGGQRLMELGDKMYDKTKSVDPADVKKVVDASGPFDPKQTPSDEKKITNFVAHHARVFDVVNKSEKYKKVLAQMAELRSIDYGFLLPDCYILPMIGDLYSQLTDTGIEEFALQAAQLRGSKATAYSGLAGSGFENAITDIANAAKSLNNGADKNVDKVASMVLSMFHPSLLEPLVMVHQICHTGLLNRKPFMQELTGSTKIAAACRALSKGCHKNCPAALGHMADAYPLGTVAPGTSGGSFWVNVLRKRPVFADDSVNNTPAYHTTMEWVPAPAMMVATLTSLKRCEAKLHRMVVKEYACLKSKQGIAERPPCSELDTFDTSAALTALRTATEKLQAKGLSADQCLAIAGADFGGSRSRSRSRSGSRSRKRRRRKSKGSRRP
jgi:hypothetical protein